MVKKYDNDVAVNKKAYFSFEITDTIEAGISLVGTEVKSARDNGVSLDESYARVANGKARLINAYIDHYSFGNLHNHEPRRERTLLLHHKEAMQLEQKMKQAGLTLVPIRMYFKKGFIKVLLGLAKGKKKHEKRDTVKERDANREIARRLRQTI